MAFGGRRGGGGTTNPPPSTQRYNVVIELFSGSVGGERRVSGARTFIDGSEQISDGAGVTGWPGLTAGNHTLRVEAAGYEPVQTTINVAQNRNEPYPNETNPSFRVAMSRGGLSQQSYNLVVEVFDGAVGGRRVSGAAIEVDGGETRTSDGNGFAHFYLQGGARTVRISRSGFETAEIGIQLDQDMGAVYPSGENAGLRVALTRGAIRGARTGAVRASNYSLADDQGEFSALGATMMWALWGYKYDRARLEANLDFLARSGIQYIRALGTLGARFGVKYSDYWRDRWMSTEWNDYDEMIAGLTDLAYDKYGIRVQWTVFGGAFGYSQDERRQVIDRFLAMSRGREHKIIHFEIGNESWQTGFEGDSGASEIRGLSRYMNDRTDILVAVSDPGESGSCEAMKRFYDGGVADIGTVHFDRSLNYADNYWRPIRQPWGYHNEMHCGFTPPRIGSNNEPIGPGASVAADENPLRMVTAALITYLSRLPLYVFHSDAGIRGTTNFYDYAVPATQAFGAMSSYLPAGITNWDNFHSSRANSPFTVDRIWPEEGGGHGVVRLYGAMSGGQVFAVPMGILNYTDLTARRAMELDVIHPVTGEVVKRLSLSAGERFRLDGLEAYVLKGVMF
jgi:hypothetical protein